MSGPAASGTLWVGIGNRLRRDDGVGPAVAEQLAAAGLPARSVLQPLPELVLDLAGVVRVVFLDADREGAPGAIRLRALRPAAGPAAGHGLDLPGLLALCRVATGRVPEAFVLSVGAGDLGYGEGLSPAVAAACETLTARARRLGV